MSMTLLFMILTTNTSFRSYSTSAYLLRAHLHNINMHMYITSVLGCEFSGRVRANAYNQYLHLIIMLSGPGPGPVPCLIRERHEILKAALQTI